MNASRVTTRYMPRLMRLTKHEKMFAQSFVEDAGVEDTDSDIDFISRTSKGTENPLRTRQVIDSADIHNAIEMSGGFEITYSFSNTVRPHMYPLVNPRFVDKAYSQYGKEGWSYRLLYEFLCKTWNGGQYFIDEYFSSVFSWRPVAEQFAGVNKSITRQMAQELKEQKGKALKNARGKFAKVQNMTEKDVEYQFMQMFDDWKSFSVWRDATAKEKLKTLGDRIRDDIIECMSMGILTLRPYVKDSTMEKRMRFTNFDAMHMFYASGNLIRHLNIYISLDKGDA